MEWKLYIHTNRANGKMYIGITGEDDVNKRWKNGRGYDKQMFGRAIEKYGWDGFTHEVFAVGSEEYIKKLEEELIKKYKTQERAFGYNVRSGGDGGKFTREHKETLRDKLREVNGKRIYQYEVWGEFVKEYKSLTELEKSCHNAEKVKACCASEMGVGYYNGYKWSYTMMSDEEVRDRQQGAELKLDEEMTSIDHWLEKELEKNYL